MGHYRENPELFDDENLTNEDLEAASGMLAALANGTFYQQEAKARESFKGKLYGGANV